jgi:hypothetical protein
MKLCIECKYFSQGTGPGYERCESPKNEADINTVNGSKTMHWIYCDSHRKFGLIDSFVFKACGRRGRWFEPAREQP